MQYANMAICRVDSLAFPWTARILQKLVLSKSPRCVHRVLGFAFGRWKEQHSAVANRLRLVEEGQETLQYTEKTFWGEWSDSSALSWVKKHNSTPEHTLHRAVNHQPDVIRVLLTGPFPHKLSHRPPR